MKSKSGITTPKHNPCIAPAYNVGDYSGIISI